MEARLDAARHAEEIGVIGLWLRAPHSSARDAAKRDNLCEALTYIAALVGVTRHMMPGT